MVEINIFRWREDRHLRYGETVLITAVIISLLYYAFIWWKNRRHWFLGSKIPGPTSYPIIGNGLLLYGLDGADFFNVMNKLHKQFGTVFRLWVGCKLTVILSNPDDAENTIGNKKLTNRGGHIYLAAKPFFNNGLLLSRGETWRYHKKLVTSGFNNSILDSFVGTYAKNAIILVDQLLKKADGITFDLYPYVFKCSLDIIVETVSGNVINSQGEPNCMDPWYMLKSLEIIFERFRKPWLLIDWILNLTSIGQEQRVVIEYLDTRMYEAIEERIKIFQKEKTKTDLEDEESIRKKRLCLLDIFVECQKMDKHQIRDEGASIVGAGSETSATTLCYILSVLGEHQDIQDKVFEEQLKIFDDISTPATAADIKEMAFLEQVIKETMRLFPPVPFVFRSTSEELEISNGIILPKGTFCVVDVYNMHRNPEYFPEPDRFDPERFSKENIVDIHPYSYVPFGAGRRLCVGYQFAIMEIKTILSTLIRQYRVTRIPGGLKGLEKKLQTGLILKPGNGFPMQLLPRNFKKTCT